MSDKIIISGSSNKALAKKIAKEGNIKLAETELTFFPSGDSRIHIKDDLKDKVVFILQSTNGEIDHYIVQTALIADAARRLGAKRIVAMMPWFGYSPQDKVFREGESLSSDVVIKMLESSPIDEFLIMDIHSTLVLDMFTKPVKHMSAMDVFIDYFKERLDEDWVAAALDKGATDRAKKFSDALGLELVQFDKTRDKESGKVTFNALKGNVNGKKVISFDDFTASGGTRMKASKFLKEQGAIQYYDCVTHLLVAETAKKFQDSKIDKIFITDTIYLDKKYQINKMEIISVAPLLSQFINTF